MSSESSSNKTFIDFLKVFIGPVLINKAFMLYFGLNYSMYPGEGYGYGLVFTILFFLIMSARFIWKYRNIEDP